MRGILTYTGAGFLGLALTTGMALAGNNHGRPSSGGGSHPGSMGPRPSAPAPVYRPQQPAMRPSPAPAPSYQPSVQPPPSRPQPTVRPTPAPAPLVRPGSTVPVVLRRPGGTNLAPSTNQGLLAAENVVGPRTKEGLQAALEGRPLTAEQVNYLQGALEKNPNLTPAMKASIASALQADAAAKRQQQGGNGNGGGTVVVAPGGYVPVTGGGSAPAPGGGDSAPGFAPAEGGEGSSPGAAGGDGPALQTTRYILVNNRTGRTLTVYMQTPQEQKPHRWVFQPDEDAYLAVDGVQFAANQVWIWAESGNMQWYENKENVFNVVPEPYPSDAIATHTHTFK